MRYFVGFLVTMGLIFLLVILLFRGSGKPKVPLTTKTIDSYATTNAETILTIDGQVNAASLHRQLRITVDRDDVTYEEIEGYEGHVTKMEHYSNNESAYTNFLLALGHAGFTNGDDSKLLRDERGYCAEGQRYIFELRQDNKDIERYWATSCGKPKTYLGVLSLTLELFQAQVPNYDELTRNVEL